MNKTQATKTKKKQTKSSSRPKPITAAPPPPPKPLLDFGEIAPTITLNIDNGCVIVAGDAHYIPNELPSTAHRALVKVLKGDIDNLPRIRHLVINGDVLDASSISKHNRIGWEVRPVLKEELELCQDRMHEIDLAASKGCSRSWTVGNHDQLRFDSRLAALVPEFFGIHGFALADHFPNWEFAWSCEINDDIVVKHRWKGGAHAPYNNCVASGKTIITGHLHSAKVIPYTDYSGTRFGVSPQCRR